MSTTTLYAIIKEVNSTKKESSLLFAEQQNTAEQLFKAAIVKNENSDCRLKLVSFSVIKDRLDDFIVGEDDDEKLQFLTNALFSLETPYELLKEHIYEPKP